MDRNREKCIQNTPLRRAAGIRRTALNSRYESGRTLSRRGVPAALPRWYRPKHQHHRSSAPTADTAPVLGTLGIFAWLHRSGAGWHPKCPAERTVPDPGRGRRRGDASPCPRDPAAGREAPGSCDSSGSPPLLLVDRDRGFPLTRPGRPTMARKPLPAIVASSQLMPPASPNSRIPATWNGQNHGTAQAQLCRRRVTC